MPRKKGSSHVSFRNGDLFCYNCGQSFNMQLPQPMTFIGAVMKEFGKAHAHCPKTWETPVADQSWSELQKAMWWFDKKNGEHGESSMAIYKVLMGAPIGSDYKINDRCIGLTHPSDPDDFRRCYLLLQTVPEWKAKMFLMKQVSPVWNKLIDRWDELTAMLEEGLKITGEDKQSIQKQKDSYSKMYNLMKELRC